MLALSNTNLNEGASPILASDMTILANDFPHVKILINMRSLEQSDALADALNEPLLNVQLQAELQRRSFIGEATIDKESTIGPGSIPEEPPSHVPLTEILAVVRSAIPILLMALKFLDDRSKTMKKNDNLKEVVLKKVQKSVANPMTTV
jgi:hypothetical protein